MVRKVSDYKGPLQKILERSCPKLSVQKNLTFKNCFGAVAGYVEGNIFCVFGQFGFALKLPKASIDALFKIGGQPLRYFPKGHIKKDYAVIPETIMIEKEKMTILIRKSVKFSTEANCF